MYRLKLYPKLSAFQWGNDVILPSLEAVFKYIKKLEETDAAIEFTFRFWKIEGGDDV